MDHSILGNQVLRVVLLLTFLISDAKDANIVLIQKSKGLENAFLTKFV